MLPSNTAPQEIKRLSAPLHIHQPGEPEVSEFAIGMFVLLLTFVCLLLMTLSVTVSLCSLKDVLTQIPDF